MDPHSCKCSDLYTKIKACVCLGKKGESDRVVLRDKVTVYARMYVIELLSMVPREIYQSIIISFTENTTKGFYFKVIVMSPVPSDWQCQYVNQ